MLEVAPAASGVTCCMDATGDMIEYREPSPSMKGYRRRKYGDGRGAI